MSEKIAKPTNTLFVSKEEKAIAEAANLMSARTRASVEEIAKESLNDEGKLDQEAFTKNLKKKFKKVTQGEPFDNLVALIALKFED